MTQSQLHDFASTKERNLPERKGKHHSMKYKER